MRDSIRHRGPDASGSWSDPNAGIWLAHRRLAIVDLSDAGAQPMSTPDGRGHLSYNGEIYNTAPLRTELEAAGYRFNGHSDTEVILFGCHHWGIEKTARKLIGMFAFAYWDARDRTLSLVRDRLGKKPLYWAETTSGIAFGSELLPLMKHPDGPWKVDRSSVAEYLRTHYIAAPASILEGVNKLPPATILTYAAKTATTNTSCYWRLEEKIGRASATPPFRDAREIVTQTEELLRDATKIRMVADVPLGAFLSSGVDSSLVTALMQRVSSTPVKTFCIGYGDVEFDESKEAERIAAHLGTDHTSFILEPADALAVIPKLPTIFDEPFADASQIPTFIVSQLARQHVTVALTGDGGDEVFGGYNRHVAAAGLLKKLAHLPRPLQKALSELLTIIPPDRLQKLLAVLPSRYRARSIGEKLHKLGPIIGLERTEQYHRLVSHWENPDEITIGGQERNGAMDLVDSSIFPDAVSQMRFLDLVTYLPGDILTKVDRASMAVSLETRAPLLDHRLVEFSFRIPTSDHIRNGQGKWILRAILERHVPRPLWDRPKSGFSTPIGDWLRGPLKDWAEDLLSVEKMSATGLIRPEPVRQLWHDHVSGRTNAQYKLWPVLMLQAWHETYSRYLRN